MGELTSFFLYRLSVVCSKEYKFVKKSLKILVKKANIVGYGMGSERKFITNVTDHICKWKNI